MRLWLASGSPRRKQLLQWSGYDCDVHPQDIDESRRDGESPVAYALRLAHEKASGGPTDRLVLAADTIVHRGESLYSKPTDRADARRILSELSGSAHTVTTSVCLRWQGRECLFAVHTDVRLRDLTANEIRAYVDSGEADDKAGAYGIQGRAGSFVADLRGCWTNVMGLPMERVLAALSEWGT
jgi:septum formation protein